MTCLYEEKAKKKYFFWKKIQNGQLKKTKFFKSANSQNVFAKISQIGPWLSRIDWCEERWWGSMYVVVRLSNISSKTGKEYIFCVFRSFLSLKFSWKIIENWQFWVGHFFAASFPRKQVKVYWLARMGQNFDQAKYDNTCWPKPHILTGSVLKVLISLKPSQNSGFCWQTFSTNLPKD